MSIRERQLFSLAYSAGNTSRQQIPRDAVFHFLRVSCFSGSLVSTQGSMGTGPTLVPGFPWTLIRQIRIIRNGSDVVFSASGEQMAKEHFYLNNMHPFARLYTVTSNVETLRTATVRGLTVPANSQGIGENMGGFAVPDAPGSSVTLKFDFQSDIMFQTGVDDDYYATLVDARPLADFAIEVDWALESASIAAAGTANTSTLATFSLNILSVDQDNVKDGLPYGTFKRSQYSQNAFPYGTGNNQILLPRGNLMMGLIFGTKAYKAGSSINAIAENDVIANLEMRVNTNLSLKKFDFRQLQANNIADHGGRQNALGLAEGSPQGYAYLSLVNATQTLRESVPSFAFDQFDVQVSTRAASEASNGVTTNATNPLIDVLIEEVIPGVSMSPNAPQGAQAGSIARTSAKPFGR